ncbi:MAG: flavin reductase family protein [Candidatus Hodarchaeota archaeon]
MIKKLVRSNNNLSNLFVPVPTVVTTFDEKEIPNAFTVSYATSINWKPPIILISVDPKNESAMNIRATKKFTIKVLRKDKLGKEIAGGLGYISGYDLHKFSEFKYLKEIKINSNKRRPPVVNGAILVFHCEFIKEYEYNELVLIIGEIKESRVIEELRNIEKLEDRSKIWRLFEELALIHVDLHEYSQIKKN